MYDGYWLRMERQQREARGRASARPPREVGEGLRALGIKSEALEGQCDCESLFCEEARDHRPGHCPRPPQSYVRAFGIRTKLCGQCITRWGQTAGTDMRVIGSDDRRKDICICTHSRDDHDEKGYCDCCECNGYTPREKAKEASMSGSNTVGYTIKGRAKVSSFSTPENVGRFVEAAIGKWGKDFSLGRPLGKRGGAVRDWDAGQYGEASNAVETLRSNGIQATLHFHGGGVELVVPDGEEDRAQQLLGGSASWRPDVEPPKEPSWMRYFKRDYKGEPVTSGISQAGPAEAGAHPGGVAPLPPVQVQHQGPGHVLEARRGRAPEPRDAPQEGRVQLLLPRPGAQGVLPRDTARDSGLPERHQRPDDLGGERRLAQRAALPGRGR